MKEHSKGLQKTTCQLEVLFPVKLSYKNEGERLEVQRCINLQHASLKKVQYIIKDKTELKRKILLEILKRTSSQIEGSIHQEDTSVNIDAPKYMKMKGDR